MLIADERPRGYGQNRAMTAMLKPFSGQPVEQAILSVKPRSVTATRIARFSLTVAVCFAATAATAQPDRVFDATGIQSNREYASQVSFEHIDTLSGGLVLTFTDLVIPGNAGNELRIVRRYNSKNFGWTMGVAGVVSEVMIIHEGNPPPGAENSEIATYLPKLKTPDGGEQPTTWMAPAGGPDAYRWVSTAQHLRFDRVTKTLYYPDGRVSTFEQHGGTWKVRNVIDRFGNALTYARTDTQLTITQSFVGGGSRDIVLNFESAGQPLPSTMVFAGRTWQYGVEPGYRTVTPPIGRGWRYGFDGGELTSVETPNGGTISYTYESVQFLREQDPGGQITVNSRVVKTRTTSGSSGGSWTYTYGDVVVIPGVPGGVTTESTIAGEGIKTIYVYGGTPQTNSDLDDGVALAIRTVQENRDGEWQTIEKEERTYQAILGLAVVDERKITRNDRTYTTKYVYDPANNSNYHRPTLITETGDFSRTTSRTYEYSADPCLADRPWFGPCVLGTNATETVEESGISVHKSWTHDLQTGFRKTETVNGVTRTFTAATDGSGNVGEITDGRNNKTSLKHTWGVVSEVKTPNTLRTREVGDDSLIASEKSRGFVTKYHYDASMRLFKIEPPAGKAIVTTYAPDGTWITVSRDSSSTRTDLDGFGRATATANAMGVKTLTTYDAHGRKTFESLPFKDGAVPGDQMAYDGLGRLRERRHADNKTVTSTYEEGSGGFDVRLTDENGRVTVQHWQAAGDPAEARLAGLQDANGKEWTYAYHVSGALASVTAPENPDLPSNPRTWTYNANSQLAAETHPESGTVTYPDYDAAGNLTKKIDQSGTVFIYDYDGDNRLKKVTASREGAARVTTIAYEDDSDKRQTVAVEGGASVTFKYDAAGRLEERTELVNGRTLPTKYTYEGDDLDMIKYPGGRAVEYSYNAEGQVISVRDVTHPGVETYYAKNVTYHPSGAIQSYETGNGLTRTFTYDANRHWPTRIAVGSLLSIDYENYDAAGNVGKIVTKRNGATTASEILQYDALDRLKDMESQLSYGAGHFDYDVHGNRLSNNHGAYEYFPGTLRLKKFGLLEFGYDGNGNLNSGPGGAYTYTLDNMLHRATVLGQETTYEYDGDQQRVRRVTGAGTSSAVATLFSYGPAGQLLGEYREAPPSGFAPNREYIYIGSRLIADVTAPNSGSTTVSVQLSVTSADPGGEFHAPATVTLTATATTTEGTIQRVEFYNGETRLHTAPSAPYTISLSGLGPGIYTFTAKAVNSVNRAARASQTVHVIQVGFPTHFTVVPDPAVPGQPATITVFGGNPCGALQFNYGDGSPANILPVEALPYQTTHIWATDDIYTVTVTGHGNCARSITQQVVVGTPNARPVVALTQPPDGASVPAGSNVTIAATASDPDPDGSIARVEFYAGATLIATVTAPPYTASWAASTPGTVVIRAIAYDNLGKPGEATRTIIVSHLAGVTVTPASIQEGMSATVTVTGLACGALQIDYGDGFVESYPLPEQNPFPFSRSHTWTSAGAKTIIVTGHASCLGSVSTPLTVVGNTAPTVSLTAPASGASFDSPASIGLSANAQDSDGSIARVEFYAGTTLVGTSTTAPFAVTWAGAASGTYSLTAKAFDNAGASTVSQPVAISVSDIAAVTVAPSPIQQGQTGTVTVTGNPSCGAVQIDYGDGTVETYPLTGLPLTRAYAWNAAGPKTIVATGQGSCIGVRATAVSVTANALPTVAITAPAAGAVLIVGQTVTLSAAAEDSDGSIARVEFLEGATVIATDTSAPYSASWTPAAPGTYSLSARAVDNANGVNTSSVSVTVRHLSGVSIAPASVLQGVAATVVVSGSSACGAIQIDYGDGTVITHPLSSLPASYSHAWATTGTKTVTVMGQASCVGTVTGTVLVNANTPPTVTLTSPPNGATYIAPQSVTLSAAANDADGSIARVEFLHGSTVIGSVTSAPFTMTWSPGPGSYAVTARAFDNGGFSSTSATANINVKHVAAVSVSPSSVLQGIGATVTVTGSSACGAITIDYGDGTVLTYALSGLPFSQTHAWATTGTKTVTATGQGGCVGTASGTVTVNTNAPPTVSLTSPGHGASYIVGQAITLSASASDADGSVNRVEFLNGGSVIGTISSAPYTMTWAPAAGTYALSARAIDNGNLTGTSGTATVTMTHIAGVSVSPSTVVPNQSATVTVSGSSSCGAVHINYGDGPGETYALSGLPISQSRTWSSPGTRTITVTGQGNCVGSASTSIAVIANPAPSVTLTAPGSGAVYTTGTAVTITASASDAHGVARVEFYAGSSLLGTDYSAPYSQPWSVASGTLTIFARAYDAYGLSADSAGASVTGRNIDPRMSLDAPAHGSVTGQPILIGGWAVDLGAPSGTGIDAVHAYAYPSGGGSIFLGAASYGGSRGDVAAMFGEQFRHSGFTMTAGGLAPGSYTIVVFSRSTVTGIWQSQSAAITIPTPNVIVTVDTPPESAGVGQPFTVAGWAIDTAHPTASGVSYLHVYAFPANGGAPTFLGVANTGGARPDVGNTYGTRFAPSGWGLPVSGLPAGWYTLVFYPVSTVTQTFRYEAAVTRTVYIAW